VAARRTLKLLGRLAEEISHCRHLGGAGRLDEATRAWQRSTTYHCIINDLDCPITEVTSVARDGLVSPAIEAIGVRDEQRRARPLGLAILQEICHRLLHATAVGGYAIRA
jgi:hypothetical protein